MFTIDRTTNRIRKLEAVRFSDLGFTERGHLQEWIANQPSALGEELLIIQKEFAGFDDTKERLDLLALDKEGSLVIIENKLDDSGRDVVWQSLKYASYCSTLSKTNIANIYQEYLDRSGGGGRAEDLICEFLQAEDFDEVQLNHGNQQRMILVAAQFRKEVTSTVLWLLKHGLKVQCFKATPFTQADLLLLSLEQVIPLPEAEELMIGISEKEKEEQTVERGQTQSRTLRAEFWQKMLEALEEAGVDLYKNVGPSRDHWLSAGSGLSGAHYDMIFSKDGARVDLTFSRSSKEENKVLFDALFERREEIERRFGSPLEWRRLDDKKASIVEYGKAFDGYDKANWPEMIQWLVRHLRLLEAAMKPEIPRLKQVVLNGRAPRA